MFASCCGAHTSIVAGIAVNLASARRHIRLVRDLEKGELPFPPSTTQAVATAIFLALVGLAMAIYLVSVHSTASF